MKRRDEEGKRERNQCARDTSVGYLSHTPNWARIEPELRYMPLTSNGIRDPSDPQASDLTSKEHRPELIPTFVFDYTTGEGYVV